jgi:hypothetical protein
MGANVVQSGMAAVTNIGSKFKCFIWELRSSGILCSEGSGNFLPTFRDNLSVPSSRVDLQGFDPLKMGPIGCSVTLVRNYHYLPQKSTLLTYFVAEAWNHAKMLHIFG